MRHLKASNRRLGTASVSPSAWIPTMRMRRNIFSALIATMIAILTLLPSTAGAQTVDARSYKLRVNDKIAIKIGQWKSVEEKYENWVGMSGTYTIGPNGTISLSLVGSIDAAGATTDEVARKVSSLLQTKIGLANAPGASVEIAEFGPIYVVGDVNTPGEFRYRLNMTVLQAVGLAGGILRSKSFQVRADRDRLQAVREFNVLQLQRWALLAKKARFDAELEETKELTPPPGLATSPSGPHLIKSERAILASRQQALKSKLAAIEDLRRILKTKLETLAKEIALHTRQLESTREQLEQTQSLLKKGLTTRLREAGLERVLTEAETKLLSLQVLNLTTEQQLNTTRRDELDLINTRRQEVVNGLQETQLELDQTNIKLLTAEALVNEAVSFGALVNGPDKADAITELTYVLQRRVDGKIQTTTVTPETNLNPGDTLQVTLRARLIGPSYINRTGSRG